MHFRDVTRLARAAIFPATGVFFMAVYLLDLEYVPSVRGLDLSWHTMLAYAHAQNLQHGVDVIFNYGPLSFIESAIYFEQTHREKLVLRALYFVILGAGFFSVLRIRGVVALLAWCCLTMLLLMLRDVYLLFPALLLCHHETHRKPGDAAQLALSILLVFDVAFACLVKSTALFFAVPAIVLASMYRIRIRDYRPIVPACFVLFLILLFWFSGQDISNLFVFLRGYIDVSRAHNADMGLPAPPALHLAFIAGAVVVATTLRRRGAAWLVIAMLTLGYLLVAYKMGFMRHGEHPEAAFLALAFVAAVQLWSPDSHFRNHIHRRLLAGVAIAAALFVGASPLFASLLPHGSAVKGYASVVQHRIRYVSDPAFRAASDAEGRRRHAVAVAEAGAAFPFGAVQGPIDIFPFEFGLAYASGLPIASRPAFQSYFATSRYMTERNADFLDGARSPRSVVFGIMPIDGRLAALEDPLTLRAYRRAYQIDRQTPEALLLTRRAVPLTETQSCRTSVIAFGEPLLLPALAPEQALWAQVALQPTWTGRVLALFAGPPTLAITITTVAGRRDFRFLREAAEVGFLLSPALVSTDGAARFFKGEGRPEDRVVSMQVPRPGRVMRWFADSIPVKLCTLSWAPAP